MYTMMAVSGALLAAKPLYLLMTMSAGVGWHLLDFHSPEWVRADDRI